MTKLSTMSSNDLRNAGNTATGLITDHVRQAMIEDLRRASEEFGFGDFDPIARYKREHPDAEAEHHNNNRAPSPKRARLSPSNGTSAATSTVAATGRSAVAQVRADRARNEVTTASRSAVAYTSPPNDIASFREITIEPAVPELENDTAQYLNAYTLRPSQPIWFKRISPVTEKRILRKKPQSYSTMDSLKQEIQKCIDQSAMGKHQLKFRKDLDSLRDIVHRADVALDADSLDTVVKKTRILEAAVGLPRIFEADSVFPDDLKADAYSLYFRWNQGIFDPSILRGIKTVKSKDRSGDSLEPSYQEVYHMSAKFYGEGHLVPGQWWPTQLTTLRDGAHGSSQGGISGDADRGVYSIVMSSGGYDDRDNGDTIKYSGTDGKLGQMTAVTKYMLKSYELKTPVRVLRSAGLHPSNIYRPECGFRYDGLYKVTGYTVTDKEKQIHVFDLERLPGQVPIRYKNEGGNTKRPCVHEVQEFERLWGKLHDRTTA